MGLANIWGRARILRFTKYKGLDYPKDYKKFKRKLSNYMSKYSWYIGSKSLKNTWRENLPEEWKGNMQAQSKLPRMKI